MVQKGNARRVGRKIMKLCITIILLTEISPSIVSKNLQEDVRVFSGPHLRLNDTLKGSDVLPHAGLILGGKTPRCL